MFTTKTGFMALIKKNWAVFIILLLAALLVLLVIWIYDRRIDHLEKNIPVTQKYTDNRDPHLVQHQKLSRL